MSLNNTEYAGLGDPVPMVSIGLATNTTTTTTTTTTTSAPTSNHAPPPAMGYDCLAGPHTTVTVSGLLPGEAYVFAVAAYSANGTVLGSGIG